MQLTPDEFDLLRASFRHVAQAPGQAAALFYDRLFAIAPETRALFPAEMEEQGRKMMNTLGLVVSQLHDLDAMRPVLAALAQRHVAYGARPEHYALLAGPLDYMMSQMLADRYTEAVAAAWQKAFAALAAAMIAAAHPPPHATPE
jgi:nitric oxide dioxygenase